MPACVPKYVTELTIPEPMPVDQECSKQVGVEAWMQPQATYAHTKHSAH